MRGDGEEALVAAAKNGDADAWEVLYLRIYPRLAAFVWRRVDGASVDDVVNEVMARAVASIRRFRYGGAGFDPWIFGIARRTIADHYRRRARLRRSDDAGGSAGGVDTAPDPTEGVELAEEYRRVRQRFELLGDRDRELLELRVVAGLSVEEVATALGKRPGAVRTAQSRALARLRTLMEVDDA